MPMTAMVRNLATMTRVGLLAPGSAARDGRRAAGRRRAAQQGTGPPDRAAGGAPTYESGRGVRGRHSWQPVREVVDALDAAFYAASASRAGGQADAARARRLGLDGVRPVAGVPGLTPRDAAAAMALVTAATEHGTRSWLLRRHAAAESVASGAVATRGLTTLSISPRQRLDDVVAGRDDLPFGGTDCALPMVWAHERARDVDTFVVYTDTRPGPATCTRRRLCAYRERGHPGQAGRGRHDVERVQHRRPERRRHARRGRFRHVDAAGHRRLRRRRTLGGYVAGRGRLPPTCAGGRGRMRPRRLDRRGRRGEKGRSGCSPTRQRHRSQTPVR